MYSLSIKFQEKIVISKKVIKLWNFCNFGISEIIPKILVTLRFSKIPLHELKGSFICFQMRYCPHFYADPTHSNTYFSKVGKWRVLLQGTVCQIWITRKFSHWLDYVIHTFFTTFRETSFKTCDQMAYLLYYIQRDQLQNLTPDGAVYITLV